MCSGDSGETEPVEGSLRVQGPDNDLMDGETEGDSVVIAGQPEVLSTQAMQVSERTHVHTRTHTHQHTHTHTADGLRHICVGLMCLMTNTGAFRLLPV